MSLIIAPAGWGKSTVARLLSTRWTRAAFCDVYGVSDAGEFSSRLLAALLAIAPEESRHRIRVGLESSSRERTEAARAAWREDDGLESVTVFENLEHIADHSEAVRFLDSLLDRPHPSRSVIVCSRVQLRLRTSRFAPPHETVLIGENELRLQREDLQQVFSGNGRGDLKRIEDATQGWPIAVFYLARAAETGSLEQAIGDITTRGSAPLESYLLDEVISQLDQRQREVLVCCASIGDCTLGDVTRITDLPQGDAEATLATLPFVRRATDGSFEVHPLLRTLAVNRLQVDSAALLERAATSALKRGDTIRAAELFARCGKMRDAAAAIADTPGYMVSAPSARVSRVLGMLDEATLMAFPNLWSAAVYARTYSVGIRQRIAEGRTLWASMPLDAEFSIRAGVVATYIDGCGVSGLLDEAESALQCFQRSPHAGELDVGAAFVALWRSVFDVWRSKRVDLPSVIGQIQPLLAVDATDALYYHTIVAHYFREHGDREAEAAAHAHAIEAAERSGLPLVQVLVWGEAAIHHWFWGNDGAYARAVAGLEAATVPSVYEGVRFMTACIRGLPDEPFGLGNHKTRVNACLIGAGTVASREAARRLALRGIETADARTYPFHRILTRIALAVLNEGSARKDLSREACSIATSVDSAPLKSSVAAFAAGEPDLGMLAAFVRRYEAGRSSYKVNVLSPSVLRDGALVKLSGRHLEIVVALALHRSGVSRERLADWLWPDLTTEGGLGALRVEISRLRRALGSDAVLSAPGGYALAPAVRVDLKELEAILSSYRVQGTLVAAHLDALRAAATTDFDDLLSRTSGWEWFAQEVPHIEAIVREASITLAQQAISSGDWDSAISYTLKLTERDELDALAQDLLRRARAHLSVGAAS